MEHLPNLRLHFLVLKCSKYSGGTGSTKNIRMLTANTYPEGTYMYLYYQVSDGDQGDRPLH